MGVAVPSRPEVKRFSAFALAAFLAAASFAQPDILFHEPFDGGIPPGWEISPGNPEGAVWQWSAAGRADSALLNGAPAPALFWNLRPPIASPSAANGAAMYNSDVYDSGGLSVGQGPFPGNHSGALTSPPIDCSGQEIVYLRFNQYARANTNAVSTLLEVSNDGGQSWTAFPINRAVVENAATAPDEVVVADISGVAAFQPDVRVRFSWQGRYYFWLIDDVQLITPPEVELQLGRIFYAPASFAQPTWQIAADTFGFAAQASNLGHQPVSGLVLKASILRVMANSTSLLYSDSIIIEEFPALTKDSTIFLTKPYAPLLPEGEYLLRYELFSLSQPDFNPTDNLQQRPFRVSNRQFAKEDDIDFGARPQGTGGYRAANYYQISPLAADNFFVDKAIFAAAVNPAEGTLAGREVQVLLYKVKEEVSPDFSNFDIYSDESLELAGYGSYLFTPADANFSLRPVPIESPGGGPAPLEAGGRYFLVTSYEGPASIVLQAFNDDIDYFQLSTIIFKDEWYLDGFGPELAAVLRMEVGLAAVPARELLPEPALRLFPNPARDFLNVEVRLDEATPAMIIIANAEGKVLDIREYGRIREDMLPISLSGYPAGAYLLRLSTEKGVRTMPFVVGK